MEALSDGTSSVTPDVPLRDRVVPVVWSLAAVAAWAVLSARRPTVTYHLAPPIVAAAWPIVARLRRGRLPRTEGLLTAAAATGLALVAAVVLHAAAWLEGPVFTGGTALGESVIFAGVAGAWATWILVRERDGVFATSD